jgi:hypothetical protein
MHFSETKKIVLLFTLLLLTVFIVPDNSNAADYSSGSFTVKDPVIDSGFQSSSSLNFGLGQSLSQIAIGRSASASFKLWSGFQYYYKVDANVLTATAGDAEVDLSWTVPQTYLGVNVSGYEVGTGTTSGSYTFEDVGNVTAFTKTGLINGTPYYFIIKTYAPGGTFLVFSNEATATPNGVVPPPPPPPPPPGGGGGGSSYGSIVMTGTAYPFAVVTILRDSAVVTTTTADAAGNFNATLTNQPSGTYTYGVYATDANGNRSPTLGFERVISNSVTTSVSDIVVAPTIQQSHTTVKQGETIVFSGYSAPNVSVTLSFAGSQSFTRTVTSDTAGFYTHSLSTSGLPKGNYSITSFARVGGSDTPLSFSLNFTIGDQTVTPPPPGSCGRSDLNCDGRVDLVDFSILLYYWESTDFARNPRVDIDKNGVVGLRDLSIMLYDWTG